MTDHIVFDPRTVYLESVVAPILAEEAAPEFKVGDRVHAGLANPGGAGWEGIVQKIMDGWVWLQIDDIFAKFGPRIIKAPIRNVIYMGESKKLHESDLYPLLGDRDSVDASELGLPPGSWPNILTVGGQVYQKVRAEKSNGELVGCVYSSGAKTITVFNEHNSKIVTEAPEYKNSQNDSPELLKRTAEGLAKVAYGDPVDGAPCWCRTKMRAGSYDKHYSWCLKLRDGYRELLNYQRSGLRGRVRTVESIDPDSDGHF